MLTSRHKRFLYNVPCSCSKLILMKHPTTFYLKLYELISKYVLNYVSVLIIVSYNNNKIHIFIFRTYWITNQLNSFPMSSITNWLGIMVFKIKYHISVIHYHQKSNFYYGIFSSLFPIMIWISNLFIGNILFRYLYLLKWLFIKV